jgi:hypothetical protein
LGEGETTQHEAGIWQRIAGSGRSGASSAPVPRALIPWSTEIRGAMVRIFVCLGALAVMALGAAELLADPPTAGPTPLPRSPWIEVSRPQPAFALAMPDLAPAEHHYAVRRHSGGGGRKDLLTWGDLAIDGPFARIEIYRPGKERETFADAATEIAARLRRLDIAEELKPAGSLDSKFGPVVLVDFALKRQPQPRRCLGFVRAFPELRMQIAGWYCNSGPETVHRATVGCALDRLAAIAAGNDPAIAQRFAQAELDVCRQKGAILHARQRRGDIADAQGPPSLH